MDRTNRCIEAFGTRPLTVRLLQIARSDIVANSVAEDIFLCGVGCDVSRALTDYNHQFRFMLHLGGLRRKDDRIPVRDDRGRRLHKNKRNLRHFMAQLLGMFHIVAAHAKDLAWLAGRDQFHVRERRLCLTSAILAKHASLNFADFLVEQPAIFRFVAIGFITNDSHDYFPSYFLMPLRSTLRSRPFTDSFNSGWTRLGAMSARGTSTKARSCKRG